jgi:hypothetical protein
MGRRRELLMLNSKNLRIINRPSIWEKALYWEDSSKSLSLIGKLLNQILQINKNTNQANPKQIIFLPKKKEDKNLIEKNSLQKIITFSAIYSNDHV